jgi:hypothetical protein
MEMGHGQKRIDTNKMIIDVIENYINLFSCDEHTGYNENTGIQLASESTLEHIKKYRVCIRKIKDSGYSDIETPIDRQTGQRLIVNKEW